MAVKNLEIQYSGNVSQADLDDVAYQPEEYDMVTDISGNITVNGYCPETIDKLRTDNPNLTISTTGKEYIRLPYWDKELSRELMAYSMDKIGVTPADAAKVTNWNGRVFTEIGNKNIKAYGTLDCDCIRPFVNASFPKISNNNVIRGRVEFDGIRLDGQNFLQECPNVEEVSFKNIELKNTDIGGFLHHLSNLKSIDVSGIDFTQVTACYHAFTPRNTNPLEYHSWWDLDVVELPNCHNGRDLVNNQIQAYDIGGMTCPDWSFPVLKFGNWIMENREGLSLTLASNQKGSKGYDIRGWDTRNCTQYTGVNYPFMDYWTGTTHFQELYLGECWYNAILLNSATTMDCFAHCPYWGETEKGMESLRFSIVQNTPDVTHLRDTKTPTISLHATVKARLTASEIAEVEDKGWVIE